MVYTYCTSRRANYIGHLSTASTWASASFDNMGGFHSSYMANVPVISDAAHTPSVLPGAAHRYRHRRLAPCILLLLRHRQGRGARGGCGEGARVVSPPPSRIRSHPVRRHLKVTFVHSVCEITYSICLQRKMYDRISMRH